MFGLKTAMNITDIKPLSTGFLMFDILIGGLPEGRIAHLFAPDGVGKTTLSLYLISNRMYIDKLEGKKPYFFYIDCEQSFNTTWFKNNFYPYDVEIEYNDKEDIALIIDSETGEEIGVIIQPIYYEDIEIIFDKAIQYVVKNKKNAYLLWDSVVKPITRKFDADKESLAFRPAKIQAIIDRYMKPLSDANITSIFINQIRDKFATQMFVKDVTGETEDIDKKIPGGWALKFAASLSVSLLKKKKFEVGGKIDERKNPFYLSGKVIEIKSGKNRIRSANINGQFLMVDDFGPSQILSSISVLIDDGKRILGNVPGKYFGSDKEIRIDSFIDKVDEYIDKLIIESAKKWAIKYSFHGKKNISRLKENMNYYKMFYEHEINRLKDKAKESAGIDIILFDNEDKKDDNEHVNENNNIIKDIIE